MDCLREISDLVIDLPDRPLDDILIDELPNIEIKMTEIIHALRAQIDIFARRRAQSLSYSREKAQQEREIISSRFNNWAVARKKIQPNATALAAAMTIPKQISQESSAREVSTINITDRISLRAIEISSIGAITRDGVLYYIARTQRFAIRLMGFVFQGNVGVVYTPSEMTPQKVHDCNAHRCDITSCRYYHNPNQFAGSRDIRNFVSSSWIYRRDDSSHDRYTNTRKIRKLSSRTHLDTDILNITPDDLSYYNEQFMHDMLCNFIMNLYVINN